MPEPNSSARPDSGVGVIRSDLKIPGLNLVLETKCTSEKSRLKKLTEEIECFFTCCTMNDNQNAKLFTNQNNSAILYVEFFFESGLRHLKLVVKDNKTTMTADATKVNEITLTFSKAVADTAAAKITVKKGNVTPTYSSAKWADDAKSVVLAMDSKLTAGTYDVTVSGIEAADLTASIPVENQKLTEFVLASDYLIADYDSAKKASIAFKAVDQYGERVNGVNATVSITLGQIVNGTGTTKSNFTTKSTGDTTVKVEDIPDVLAITGQTAKITIVDTKTGVNLLKDITYQPASKAVKVEAVGIYDANNKKVETLTAGKKIDGYKVAFKFTDQYDVAMAADSKALGDIQVTAIGGTTNVSNSGKFESNVDIAGTKYAVYRLAGANATDEFAAGSLQLTVVNTKYGLLGTTSYDVAAGTVIKSFSASIDNEVFEGESVDVSYTAIDADGKEVKSYDLLKKALEDCKGLPNGVTLKKQADGSAKMSYKYNGTAISGKAGETNSVTDVLTFQLYKGSVNTVVVNYTVRVNQKRVFWHIAGVDTAKATAGNKGTELSFKAEDFKIIDQYGNTLTKATINSLVSDTNCVSMAGVTNSDKWDASKIKDQNITSKVATMGAVVTSEGSLKIKVMSGVNKEDDGYELTLSYKNPEKASDFVIEWRNGNTFDVSTGSRELNYKDDFKVCGTVDGKKIEIPDTQYEILDGAKINMIDRENGKNIVTKEGTLKIVVTDADHKAHTISATYTYSNDYAKVTKIAANSKEKVLASSSAIDLSKIIDVAFDVKDQYGKVVTSYPTSLVADVVVIGGEASVDYNGTGKVVIKDASKLTEISVTLTCGDLSATTTITVK